MQRIGGRIETVIAIAHLQITVAVQCRGHASSAVVDKNAQIYSSL